MTDFEVRFPQVSEVLQAGIVQRLHLGAQVYVSRGGDALADAAVGEARIGEPLTSEHWLPLLSAGKPLTAVAVAQLVERGLFHFEDPVANHIPEFGAAGKHAVSVRQLLTHTSGLPNIETGWPDAPWEESLQRICEASAESNCTPGECASYNFSGSWFVLGELIQRLDGRPFPRYLREEICEPFGLKHLWNGIPADQLTTHERWLAPSYIAERGSGLRQWNLSETQHAAKPSPGSNTRGPARELGWFYESLLGWRTGDSRRMLPAKTVAELTRRHRVGLFDTTLQHIVDFGLGIIINSQRYGSQTVPYGFGPLASEATFGHGGSQSSIAFADPERQLVVVIVCNGRPGEARHQRRMRAILDALERDLDSIARRT